MAPPPRGITRLPGVEIHWALPGRLNSPPGPDEPKIVYVREDRLVQELLDRLPPDEIAGEREDVAGTAAKLRQAGLMITHDGTTWSLMPG